MRYLLLVCLTLPLFLRAEEARENQKILSRLTAFTDAHRTPNLGSSNVYSSGHSCNWDVAWDSKRSRYLTVAVVPDVADGMGSSAKGRVSFTLFRSRYAQQMPRVSEGALNGFSLVDHARFDPDKVEITQREIISGVSKRKALTLEVAQPGQFRVTIKVGEQSTFCQIPI